MKRLILAALLLQNLTAFGQDSLHCIPLQESRSLHQIAASVINMEEQLTNRNSRIVVLENQVKNQQFGFSELLQNERKKADLQAELFDHAQSISEVYKEENTHLKKKVRGLKWQRAGLGIAVIAVLILGTAQ